VRRFGGTHRIKKKVFFLHGEVLQRKQKLPEEAEENYIRSWERGKPMRVFMATFGSGWISASEKAVEKGGIYPGVEGERANSRKLILGTRKLATIPIKKQSVLSRKDLNWLRAGQTWGPTGENLGRGTYEKGQLKERAGSRSAAIPDPFRSEGEKRMPSRMSSRGDGARGQRRNSSDLAEKKGVYDGGGGVLGVQKRGS